MDGMGELRVRLRHCQKRTGETPVPLPYAKVNFCWKNTGDCFNVSAIRQPLA